MKYFLLPALLLFSRVNCLGQVEFLVPYPDTSIECYNLTHKTDDAGNLYMLSQAIGFYNGLNILIDGAPLISSVISKISPGGKLIWQEIYETVEDSLFKLYEQFPASKTPYVPTERFFLNKNGELILPFGIYTGINHWNIRRNALIIANSSTGKIIKSQIFSDTCCSYYDLQTSNYVNDTLVTIYTKREDYRYSLFAQKRVGDFNEPFLTRIIGDSLWDVNAMRSVLYDKYKDQYLVFNHKGQILLYSNQLNPLGAIKFCDTTLQKYIQILSISINSGYYAINYYAKQKNNDSDNTYIMIMDKIGNFVSNVVSSRMASIELSDENMLWATSYRTNWDSIKISRPVTIW